MHPVLVDFGTFEIYTYGFMIAIGAVAGFAYMVWKGKSEVRLTFDQANALFLIIFIAAFVGGKFFLFLEDPAIYFSNPGKLLTGRGFVFYGSFLFAVPSMLFYFKKHKLDTYKMLDVMAVTTCLVHSFGRLGCFFAGCCYGLPTDSFLGVAFNNEECFAKPLHTPLHPTQLYEALYIFGVMVYLLFIESRKRFNGQLFLSYLLCYAVGRFVIEIFRGDI
jgi:phosphatidylglycerol:prolipoprotein diacylglycerol transferase